MKFKTVLILLFALNFNVLAQSSFFDQVDLFLQKYMKNGQINYAAIKNNPEQLNKLYDMIGNMSLEGKSEAFRKAFHINAYNMLVIKQVIVFYPITTPFDVNGFFDNIKHEVCRDELTLDELEKGLMLPTYKDPRIHFALVCAAKGCPPLAEKAYRPEIVEDQLEEKTVQMINDHLFVKERPGEIRLSKIFEWYAEEFSDNQSTVLDYLNQYRVSKIPEQTKVRYDEYDWSLNDFQD